MCAQPIATAKRTSMNTLLHQGWSLLPFPLRKALKTLRSGTAWSSRAVDDQAAAVPQVGKVNFGDLRRTTPFCANYGYSRGNPVDRYYIEGFLARHAADVHGRVLEVGDHTYTRRFGGSRVTDSDVLHVALAHDGVTIVGNLETGENIPADTFDCFICTQTLNLIYDLESALRHAYRCLKPGGVLLVTVAAITPFAREEQVDWNAYWRLTSPVMRRLAAVSLGAAANVVVAGHGNVLAAASYLFGLASSELTPAELDMTDGGYEVIVTLRAVKP
jgi:SAM-dependent methyltransferase